MDGRRRSSSARYLSCLWLVCLLFFTSHLAAQIPLQRTPGNSISRKLVGGEQHIYQLPLAAAEYLNLTVDYQGLIVAVTLNDPNSKPLAA